MSGGDDMVVQVAIVTIQCTWKAGEEFSAVKSASLSSICFCIKPFTIKSSDAHVNSIACERRRWSFLHVKAAWWKEIAQRIERVCQSATSIKKDDLAFPTSPLLLQQHPRQPHDRPSMMVSSAPAPHNSAKSSSPGGRGAAKTQSPRALLVRLQTTIPP